MRYARSEDGSVAVSDRRDRGGMLVRPEDERNSAGFIDAIDPGAARCRGPAGGRDAHTNRSGIEGAQGRDWNAASAR